MNLDKALGPLKDIYLNEEVMEIIVDSFDDVYYAKGSELIEANGLFKDARAIDNLITDLMNVANIERVKGIYNYDFSLDSRTRVNVVLPPMSLKGPVLNLLKIPKQAIGWDSYLKWGAIKEDGRKILVDAIHDGKNVLVSGAAGSGKTTLLNLLATSVKPEWRIVTIERTPCLLFDRKRTARLQAPNHKVSEMQELVEAASKMRADCIIHSYIEGPETMDFINLVREGHSAMALISGENIFDAIKGLEFKALSCNYSRSIDDIRYAISHAFDYIVFQEVVASGSREVSRIARISYDEGSIKLDVLYTN
jgi:pilus assembly protein CpaF